MADITWKRTGTLLIKLFRILKDAPDGLPAGVALAKVAEGETLSEYEAGTYSTGARRFEKIVRWATVDLVKAGWLLKHKGVWSITEAGRTAYQTYPEPEAFYREAVKLYRQWKRSQVPETPNSLNDAEPTAEEIQKSNQVTFEQAEEQAWQEIESYVGNMDPYEFQKLVADLLKAMGYYPSWVSPPGKDGGLDIIAHPDPLGTRPPRIKVQVKRVQTKIAVDGVRSFLALINEDDAGLFVATGGFTREAEDLARMQERRKISLIDLERLFELWKEFYLKLDEQARERLPITPIYFITPRG
jgi:restriction system protein